MAWVSPAPLRSCAARAALPGQGRSHICFGPVMPVPLPGPPCWFGLGLGQGHQVHVLGFSGALETVRRPRGASRARARRPLAPTSVSGQLCLCHCLVRLGCSPGDWVRATKCMAWVSPAPLRSCAARAALPGQGRSHICFGPVMPVPLPGPPWLFAWRLGQGHQVHGLGFSGALETVRRPPARRFASKLCSYICFGPVMSVPLHGSP